MNLNSGICTVPDCYRLCTVQNALHAPVFYIEKTVSTMEDARVLAAANVPDGTVIFAGQQSAGRGRLDGRVWQSPAGQDLLCTVILRRPYEAGFTLKVGLAAAAAVASFLPAAAVCIKWPNDILVDGKKITGILCESDGTCLYVGIGCNIGQRKFEKSITKRATSLALECEHNSAAYQCPAVTDFLPVLLTALSDALADSKWKQHVEQRLYKKGCTARFVPGTDSHHVITGILYGIDECGQLLIDVSHQPEHKPATLISCISGELQFL